MNVGVVGTGYVGLVTGTCLAEMGNDVVCIDIDKEKVNKMRNGIIPIYEPHLDNLFERNIKQGRLRFSTELKEAVDHADVIFLALPTPPDEDGSADLKYILGVADDLGKMMTNYKIIIDKSTVPVGTAEKVQSTIANNFFFRLILSKLRERSLNRVLPIKKIPIILKYNNIYPA